jgi:hypothetical protein
MIAAAKEPWPFQSIEDDNQADALCLLAFVAVRPRECLVAGRWRVSESALSLSELRTLRSRPNLMDSRVK